MEKNHEFAETFTAVIALEAQHVDFSYTEDVKEVAESITGKTY